MSAAELMWYAYEWQVRLFVLDLAFAGWLLLKGSRARMAAGRRASE